MLDLANAVPERYEPVVVKITGPNESAIVETHRTFLKAMNEKGHEQQAYSRHSDTCIEVVFLNPERAAEAKADFLKSDRNSAGSLLGDWVAPLPPTVA